MLNRCLVTKSDLNREGIDFWLFDEGLAAKMLVARYFERCMWEVKLVGFQWGRARLNPSACLATGIVKLKMKNGNNNL